MCCTGKSQAVYEEMLETVLSACDNIGVSADASSVTTDFETAAMNAVCAKLGHDVTVRGCFFPSMPSHVAEDSGARPSASVPGQNGRQGVLRYD